MATLERPQQQRSSSTASPTALPTILDTSFHLAAVPTAFAPPATLQSYGNDDLIDLGREQLFSVASGRRQQVPAVGSSQVSGTRPTGRIPDTRQSSQELLGSLGAARHTFLFSLNGLLQQYFSSSRTPSPLIGNTSTSTPNPFSDPSSLLAPLRRYSVATTVTTTDSAPQPADLLLTTVLETLRTRSPQPTASPPAPPAVRSIERTSPLLGSPKSTSSAHSTGTHPLVEELQARVEAVAVDLPPIEAELARSLASLLTCIERLSIISQHDDSLPVAAHTAPHQDHANMYETLEREASALQARRGVRANEAESETVVGAAREVEQAERELLWGRVDDLSERVKVLSRRRVEGLAGEGEGEQAEQIVPRQAADEGHRSWSPRSETDSLYEPSLTDLPRYSHDQDAQQTSHLPPAYYGDLSDEKASIDWDAKPPQTPGMAQSPASASSAALLSSSTSSRPTGLTAPAGTRTRKFSSVHTEKMQCDLDSVSSAIERLYVVSPQLANQRVEPDRRKQRERQLAKLGNAIERLSQGRLEDQRAIPSPLMGDEVEPESKAERRKREQVALDRMLDQIDKAASRTLAEQRVELNGKRKEILNQDTAHSDFEPLSDKYEARRREYILANTGKGRLASQDAVLPSSSSLDTFPLPNPELSQPVTISEFFADEPSRSRSNSLPDNVVKKKFSSRGLFQSKVTATSPALPTEEQESPTSTPTGKKGALRIGVFKRTGSMIRRGSYDASGMTGLGVFGTGMSRSTSANGPEVLDIPQFDWITEESRNLGTLIVTFWPRASFSCEEEYEVLSVEAESILVAPSRGGPASRLSLPCRVVPQHATVQSSAGANDVKLVTIDPSPTKNRADLEVHTPLSTDDLRNTMPTSFACSTCDTQLADTSSIARYNALPSEHWAELLDAWMCHQDQELSADLIAKGKGIKPRSDEGLVGTSYVLLPRAATQNWVIPEKSEPTRSPSDDLLFPAHCASCSSLVGSHVQPLRLDSTALTTVRLLKYATYPIRNVTSNAPVIGLTPPPRYCLATFLTAEMLETGQAHACHRFVLEEAESEKARLLLWFFNPAVRLSFSSSAATVEILEPATATPDSSATSTPTGSPDHSASAPKLTSRSMNAVKVFYAMVANDEDPRCVDFLEAKSERIPYPRSVLGKVQDLLGASTLVYPPAKRKWGNLEVGFLERL
ncbi:hypothetical protein JCM11641_006885 [Rhodosporidiobolus odoratus]